MVSWDCRAKRRLGTFPKPNSQKERRFDPAKAAGPWKPRMEEPGEFRHGRLCPPAITHGDEERPWGSPLEFSLILWINQKSRKAVSATVPTPHVINWDESSAKPRAGGQLVHDLARVPVFG
jgi:hypothetical protein